MIKTLLLIAIFATAAFGVTLSAPTTTVQSGTFVVPLSVDEVSGIFAAQAVITYDPNVLTPDNSDGNFGCSAPELTIVCNVYPEPGTLRIAAYGAYTISNTNILNLTFSGTPGVSGLSFSETYLFNPNGPLETTTVNGQITVLGIRKTKRSPYTEE